MYRFNRRSFLHRQILKLGEHGLLPFISDRAFLTYKYYMTMGRQLNLDDPRLFSEKLQWLKLWDRRPEYTAMADKLSAKDFVSKSIGEKYIVPTLGVWKSFQTIDFDSLPNRFVLKCTHDSGGIVVCRDKNSFDYEEASRKLTKSLRDNYYTYGREWPYKNIKPRIIAEEYLNPDPSGDLPDYKIFCFDGDPFMLLVCSGRFLPGGLREDFFDTEWNRLDCKRPDRPVSPVPPERPECLDEMLGLAARLSKGVPFLRVDFFISGGRLYFGEMTFYPASGFEGFEPEKWDMILGERLILPKV